MTHPVLRIGTRGSPLALKQAELLLSALATAHPDLNEPGAIEVVPIHTSGDRIQDRTLAEAGGKGLFTKEIEEALLAGAVDLAVHSAKDMQTWLPSGLAIGAVLPREDPREALFSSSGARSLAQLPRGAVLGTASLRRQAQALMRQPDLKVVPFRGNVETRLRKLRQGLADATLLAVAGLKRLGRADLLDAILEPEEVLPAVGQGTIAIEIRAGEARLEALLAALTHPPTAACLAAERTLLAVLDGSCRTPIAGLAEPVGADRLRLRALIALPDGSKAHEEEGEGEIADAETLGRELGRRLLAKAGPQFLRSLK
ncbi:MAG TPA: hydroxymethylbilane synthase [Alphaproteobacteria bacterium]|nr:hydroxymethylbilane synthase [Alphaproteobacteria bacterium]